MAKTIKFNLICDEKPVRTIEDLQNNFSIEDILAYYNNKLLHRWLQVRGYTAELEKVSAITSEEPLEIIKALIDIFDVTTDMEKAEESIYMLRYLEERKEQYAAYTQENEKTKQILADYEAGYRKLVDGILAHPDDAAVIKANLAEIAANYAWVLSLDHRSLFNTLRSKSPLAIMCLLMHEEVRKYYLPVETTTEDGTTVSDTELDADKKTMFLAICRMIRQSDFESALKGHLTTFAGLTDGYWKDLEPKGKRYMIISMGDGDYVRSAGLSGGDLSSADILNKFVILDGIDYKSNSETRRLFYMEV